jgi:hypothetical protein
LADLERDINYAGIHHQTYHLFFESDYTFSEDVAGILVLQIEGDDEKTLCNVFW